MHCGSAVFRRAKVAGAMDWTDYGEVCALISFGPECQLVRELKDEERETTWLEMIVVSRVAVEFLWVIICRLVDAVDRT